MVVVVVVAVVVSVVVIAAAAVVVAVYRKHIGKYRNVLEHIGKLRNHQGTKSKKLKKTAGEAPKGGPTQFVQKKFFFGVFLKVLDFL